MPDIVKKRLAEGPEDSPLQRAKMGDGTAFAELVSLHEQRLRRRIYAMTQDFHLMQDIYQDTLLKARNGIEGFEGDGKFFSWLCSIAEKTYFQWIRDAYRKKRIPPNILDTLDEYSGVSESTHDPYELLYARDRIRIFNELLSAVDHRTAEVLKLVSLGYTYAEIALKMEIKARLVRNIKYKGLKSLMVLWNKRRTNGQEGM